MSKAQNLFRNLVIALTNTKPGTWVFANFAPRIDRWIFRVTNQRSTFSSFLTGVPTIMLTTIGRKSGLERTVPLLGIPLAEDKIAVIASNWGQTKFPAWYFNLSENPQAKITLNGMTRSYIAHVADGDEYDNTWRRALEVYRGYPNYKAKVTRDIPILILTPD